MCVLCLECVKFASPPAKIPIHFITNSWLPARGSSWLVAQTYYESQGTFMAPTSVLFCLSIPIHLRPPNFFAQIPPEFRFTSASNPRPRPQSGFQSPQSRPEHFSTPPASGPHRHTATQPTPLAKLQIFFATSSPYLLDIF